MPEITNECRAEMAAHAIIAYAFKAEILDQFNGAEILGDLLGDLRHWATRQGVDFEVCNRNAKACFEAEVREENNEASI